MICIYWAKDYINIHQIFIFFTSENLPKIEIKIEECKNGMILSSFSIAEI
jgi:hypothetical protein